MKKNKISTLSYFVKRLKDSGYIVWKLVTNYPIEDCRKWTILINPGRESVLITCMVNQDGQSGPAGYDVYDGGFRCRKNFTIVTDSMEVIVNNLISLSITPDSDEYKSSEAKEK